MRFTLLAVAAGLVIGVLAGGRLSHLGSRSLRLWPLLMAGLAAQLVSARLAGGASFALLVASYGLLLAFAAVNVVVVGMWLVALGVGLNLVVIAVNGGMPVRESALRSAGALDPDVPVHLESASKHHLERPSDRLVGLGDILPVRPLREVVSFGDVVMAVGVADVVVHLLRPLPGRRAGSDDGGPGERVEAAG
jgi:hypothetical protein